MIRFDIVTLFPDLISTYCNESILGRAQKQGHVAIKVHNLRDWTTDKHRTVDDRVFGGGPGMLLKVEPLHKAITELKEKAVQDNLKPYVIATAASGELFTQKKAQEMSVQADSDFIILCGHYEGFDARVMEFVDVSMAVGPYVLTGGELASLIMVDAITRLLPGVLGNEDSPKQETTFVLENEQLLVDGEHPQYTVPAEYTFTDKDDTQQVRKVPEILRSGHHKKIQDENDSQRVKKTLFSK